MDIGAGLGFGKEAPLSRVGQFNFFVDAALGSDSNDGTAGSPLRTFQEAVYRADESYTPGTNQIFLAPGEYDGAYISDDDLLKVFGQGANPWDVTIGGGQRGDVIQIDGGSDVRLFNMEIDGSFFDADARTSGHGIYAHGLDYLYLNNVISRYSIGSGLYAENITKVKLYHSTFEDNNEFGAYIYNGDKVRSVGSDFSYNWNDGIRADYYNRVELIATTATYNGWGDSIAEGDSEADGFEANDSDSILVNGGSYNYNDRRGIDIDYAYDMTLIGVQASYNGDKGVDAEDIYGTAVVNGGEFQDNEGSDGVRINGFGGGARRGVGKGESEGLVVNVYGGLYWNNGDDGVDVENAYEVNFHGIDARFNHDDGAEIRDSSMANVYGGYLYDNYQHGLELRRNGYSKVNGLASLNNGENGLDLRGGDRLNVLGGEYSNNGDHGIRAEGEFENANAEGTGGNGFGLLDRVDIKYATVLNNYDGVHVLGSYLLKMVGGTYSENDNYGVEVDNVSYGIFQDIVAINNGSHGLLFNAGLFEQFPVEGSREYLGGSNWNRLEFVGGLYAKNGGNGILVATNRNRGFNVNEIEMDVQHVVARDNGLNGLKVGNDFFDGPDAAEGGFGYGSNLYIEMLGGYYGFNQGDGIDLLTDAILTAEGLPEFGGGFLAASLTDVVAEFNGRNGVVGWSVLSFFDVPRGDSNGGDEVRALIDVTRGSYSFNGDNGLRFQVFGFEFIGEPDLVGEGGFFPGALASFDHVVAIQNENNGVSFGTFFGTFLPVGTLEGPRGETNGDEEYPPLVSFYGGVYNQNGRNGIRLDSDFDVIEEGLNGFGVTAARLENVEASLNGRNGLLIRNDDPDFFRGDVDIINGVYNKNGKDGIHVRGLGDLYIEHVIASYNDEDGVHSRDNWSTNISDNSIIEGNGAQNVKID